MRDTVFKARFDEGSPTIAQLSRPGHNAHDYQASQPPQTKDVPCCPRATDRDNSEGRSFCTQLLHSRSQLEILMMMGEASLKDSLPLILDLANSATLLPRGSWRVLISCLRNQQPLDDAASFRNGCSAAYESESRLGDKLYVF